MNARTITGCQACSYNQEFYQMNPIGCGLQPFSQSSPQGYHLNTGPSSDTLSWYYTIAIIANVRAKAQRACHLPEGECR